MGGNPELLEFIPGMEQDFYIYTCNISDMSVCFSSYEPIRMHNYAKDLFEEQYSLSPLSNLTS